MGEEIQLNRYFAAMWRAKWFILAAIALAGLVAAIISLRQPTLYAASAKIQVGRVWKEPLEDTYVATEVVNSNGFIHELAAKIGANPAYLKRSLHAETITAGPPRAIYPILVHITAKASSPEEAVKLARAAADELLARHDELFNQAITSHLERQRLLESLQANRNFSSAEEAIKLQRELDEVRSANSSPTQTEKSHLIGAIVLDHVERPPVVRNAAVAMLMAAIVCTGVAALFGHFRSRSPREG
jgi:capsular polysaccharide biosynthesis protein